MFIGMLFEIGGISILMPMMIVLLESDIEKQYPVVIPLLDFIGNPSKEKLIIFSLLTVFFYYVIKSTYLIFKKQSINVLITLFSLIMLFTIAP